MKVLFILFLFSFVFLLDGCNTENTEKSYTIHADFDKENKVSFSDIFAKIELIPLETNEQSLIKNITKVVVHDNNYYLLDYQRSEILTYDSAGNFLFKISDRGEGPQEYINISDFSIDKNTQKLLLLSAVNNSMYEYDLRGNFIKKYKLPNIVGAYKSFLLLNADTIAFFTFDFNNRVKLYSKSRNAIVKELFPEKDNILNKFSYYEFPYKNYFHRSASNILYKIESDGNIVNGYSWDFGKVNNSKKQIKNLEKLSSNEIHNYFYQLINSEIINHITILHGGNSKYLFTQIWRKGKHINIFHDKTNDKNYIFEKTIENATFHPLSWYEDYVIGYYSDEWGTIEETLPDAILDNNNIRIKEQLNEYDNPVLIKYYFKK